jgi:predicted SAM-dependent methyltransferase
MGIISRLKDSKFKNSQCLVGLFRDFKSVLIRFDRFRTRRAVTRYLADNPVSRLDLGAGNSVPDGWLGTDIDPQSSEIVRLDATIPFPIADQTFDYVFSEHMIEHISWHEGAFMLSECYRILKPGGTIRIATPDLKVLLGLYNNKEVSAAGENYIRWMTDNHIGNVRLYRPAFVINNDFRNWGHQFLYDKELLEIALQQAGFVNIVSCRQNESSDENLRDIEQHGRNTDHENIAEFETMVFEATRPSV